MSKPDVFTTGSPTGNGPRTQIKATGEMVVEIWFNSATYMVSPHPDRGNALALTMQGHSMAIQVATVIIDELEIDEAIWETPFSGRPPEWQGALLDLVKQHGYPIFCHILNGGGGS